MFIQDIIINVAQEFPSWLATIFVAAMPIAELRLAIPVAMYSWNIVPLNAFGLALIGNALPLIPLYFGLDSLRTFTEKHLPWATRGIDTMLNRAKGKLEKKYARYGALALFLFTALPLPVTGLWTATLASVALRVPFRYAATGILSGIVCAGVIVTAVSAGAGQLL